MTDETGRPVVTGAAHSQLAKADPDFTPEARCERCRRSIRTPQSLARHHGPACWRRRADVELSRAAELVAV